MPEPSFYGLLSIRPWWPDLGRQEGSSQRIIEVYIESTSLRSRALLRERRGLFFVGKGMSRSVFLIAVAIAAMCSCKKDAAEYVKRGDGLYLRQKYAEAELEYRNALKQNTNSFEAQYGLGLIEMQRDTGCRDFSYCAERTSWPPTTLGSRRVLPTFAWQQR